MCNILISLSWTLYSVLMHVSMMVNMVKISNTTNRDNVKNNLCDTVVVPLMKPEQICAAKSRPGGL